MNDAFVRHRYQAELKQALAEQAATTGSAAGGNGGVGRSAPAASAANANGDNVVQQAEVAQLRAQVEHQDKQKRILRQK